MTVILLHGDTAIQQVEWVLRFAWNGVEFYIDVAKQFVVAQSPVRAGNTSQVVWKPFNDVDGLIEGLGRHLRCFKIVEIPNVFPSSISCLNGEWSGIGGFFVHLENIKVGIDADVFNIIFFVGKLVVFQSHGDGQTVVQVIAVHFEKDVIAVEKVVPWVFHPLSDDFAHIVEGIGIIDIPFVDIEFDTVAHDVAPNQGVVDYILDVVDGIRVGRVDVVSYFRSFTSGFHRVGHFGMEIADIVEIKHHLCGRIVGTCRIIINGLSSESVV